MVENGVGKKKRNCLLRAISPFPTVFSKDLFCRRKIKGLFGKGLRSQKKVAEPQYHGAFANNIHLYQAAQKCPIELESFRERY